VETGHFSGYQLPFLKYTTLLARPLFGKFSLGRTELVIEADGHEQSLGFIEVFITGHDKGIMPHHSCFVYFFDNFNRTVYASLIKWSGV
jgi:hypothetical protein